MKIELQSAITSAPKKIYKGINDLGSQVCSLAKENSDKFVNSKLAKKISKTGLKKETLVGGGLIAAALACAISLAVDIKNKVDESKKILID